MSFCRFSDDDFQCEIYCYEDVSGGFTTHVAGQRYLRPFKLEELVGCATVQDVLNKLPEMEQIELPCAGMTFNDPDLTSLRKRLGELRELGYRIPDEVFQQIDQEIADELPAEKIAVRAKVVPQWAERW